MNSVGQNNEFLDFAKEIAYEAGKVIKKYFNGDIKGAIISNNVVFKEVLDVISKSLKKDDK